MSRSSGSQPAKRARSTSDRARPGSASTSAVAAARSASMGGSSAASARNTAGSSGRAFRGRRGGSSGGSRVVRVGRQGAGGARGCAERRPLPGRGSRAQASIGRRGARAGSRRAKGSSQGLSFLAEGVEAGLALAVIEIVVVGAASVARSICSRASAWSRRTLSAATTVGSTRRPAARPSGNVSSIITCQLRRSGVRARPKRAVTSGQGGWGPRGGAWGSAPAPAARRPFAARRWTSLPRVAGRVEGDQPAVDRQPEFDRPGSRPPATLRPSVSVRSVQVAPSGGGPDAEAGRDPGGLSAGTAGDLAGPAVGRRSARGGCRASSGRRRRRRARAPRRRRRRPRRPDGRGSGRGRRRRRQSPGRRRRPRRSLAPSAPSASARGRSLSPATTVKVARRRSASGRCRRSSSTVGRALVEEKILRRRDHGATGGRDEQQVAAVEAGREASVLVAAKDSRRGGDPDGVGAARWPPGRAAGSRRVGLRARPALRSQPLVLQGLLGLGRAVVVGKSGRAQRLLGVRPAERAPGVSLLAEAARTQRNDRASARRRRTSATSSPPSANRRSAPATSRSSGWARHRPAGRLDRRGAPSARGGRGSRRPGRRRRIGEAVAAACARTVRQTCESVHAGTSSRESAPRLRADPRTRVPASGRAIRPAMSAKILDGKALAARIKTELASEVGELRAQGVEPGLAVVLVGEDPASQIYVRNKTASCAQAGHPHLRSPAAGDHLAGRAAGAGRQAQRRSRRRRDSDSAPAAARARRARASSRPSTRARTSTASTRTTSAAW